MMILNKSKINTLKNFINAEEVYIRVGSSKDILIPDNVIKIVADLIYPEFPKVVPNCEIVTHKIDMH